MAVTNSGNTLASLNGLFKEVYADAVRDLVPSGVKLTKTVRFVAKSKELGNSYNQPVILANEHGVTFNDPSTTGDIYDLNAAVAGQIKNAQIKSTEMLLRSRLSYTAASRAAQGRNAFVDATEQVVRNMRSSIAKKLEVELFYGQASIGQVASVAADTITIKAAEWAPGIWAGSEGMYIQAFDALTGGTVQNTGGSISVVADGSEAMKIVSVDIAAKTITVDTGHAAGVAADDYLFFAGAYGKEFKGLHSILSYSGSDLFGISTTAYSLWKGNSYAVGGSLSFNKIGGAIDLAVAKGLDEDATVFVSNKTWTDILIDLAALRRFDSSYSSGKAELGNNEITFYSQNGSIKIVPSIYVKEGYAYLMVAGDYLRIGSSDVTFNRPGQTDTFFMDLQDASGYELRCFSDQALFCEAPGRSVVLTGITNTTDSGA